MCSVKRTPRGPAARFAPGKMLLLGLITAYRYLFSTFVGGHCRFHPTCSCYAHEAISRYGAWRGGWLALRRLARCHPWHEGGLDPVPEPKE